MTMTNPEQRQPLLIWRGKAYLERRMSIMHGKDLAKLQLWTFPGDNREYILLADVIAWHKKNAAKQKPTKVPGTSTRVLATLELLRTKIENGQVIHIDTAGNLVVDLPQPNYEHRN